MTKHPAATRLSRHDLDEHHRNHESLCGVLNAYVSEIADKLARRMCAGFRAESSVNPDAVRI
jgi:hypothetical protein